MVETLEEETQWVKSGARAAPAVANLTHQQFPDMVIGNWAGGLSYFQGSEPQPVTIKEVNLNTPEKYTIFPNPVSSSFTITLDNNSAEKVIIYNMLGMEMIQINTPQSEYIINSEMLPAGFYIVIVIIEGERVARKIIKH